jgi:hypothetical protein
LRADNLHVRGLRQLSSGICRSTFRQRARTIRSVRAQLPGNRYRSTPSLHHPHSYPAMPTALSIVLSLFGLFIAQLLLDLRKVARDVG